MRKRIVCNFRSLDGYYTGRRNNGMVPSMDTAFDEEGERA